MDRRFNTLSQLVKWVELLQFNEVYKDKDEERIRYICLEIRNFFEVERFDELKESNK